MKGFRPMLASNAEEVKFPVYASVKLDGVRAVIRDGVVLSRTLKPIPNRFVQDVLGSSVFNGLDGELTVGPANDKNVMQATMSGVMSQSGAPDFMFHVFDDFSEPEEPYCERLNGLKEAFEELDGYARVRLLQQTLIRNDQELLLYEQDALAQGHEGVIIRDPGAPYKFGRSTAKEGYLLKIKRFSDGEAEVIGVEELMHNTNDAERSALGYTKRSTSKSGKIPMDTLGALVVRDLKTGAQFSIGTGFDAKQRHKLWDDWEAGILKGRIAKYKHFEGGSKDAPRFPVFLGFRNPIDIGTEEETNG